MQKKRHLVDHQVPQFLRAVLRDKPFGKLSRWGGMAKFPEIALHLQDRADSAERQQNVVKNATIQSIY